jgi:hypothetical protein
VSLRDGGGRFSLDQLETSTDSVALCNDAENSANMSDDDDDDGEEDFHIVDLTRCEQLMGGNWQLYGVGICSLWVLMISKNNPTWDFNELLNALDDELDKEHGLLGLIQTLSRRDLNTSLIPINLVGKSELFESLLFEGTGFAYRPRKYEVAMALTRLRGLTFEELPDELDKKLEAERLEVEKRKKALADLWANRRKK